MTSVPEEVFKLRSFELPVAIVPPLTNVILAASTAMVSIESTPVRAPAVSTLRPVDVREKSPVALPMSVSDPETLDRVVFPQLVRSVKIAVPGALVPMDARFAAPVAEIFHCPSVKETSAEVLPSVKLPE